MSQTGVIVPRVAHPGRAVTAGPAQNEGDSGLETVASIPGRTRVSIAVAGVLVAVGLGLQVLAMMRWTAQPVSVMVVVVTGIAAFSVMQHMTGERDWPARAAGVFAPSTFHLWLFFSGGALLISITSLGVATRTGVWLWGFALAAAGICYGAFDIGVELWRANRRQDRAAANLSVHAGRGERAEGDERL